MGLLDCCVLSAFASTPTTGTTTWVHILGGISPRFSHLSLLLAGHIERTVLRGLDLQALHAELKHNRTANTNRETEGRERGRQADRQRRKPWHIRAETNFVAGVRM